MSQITALGALAVPLIGASGARADVASCAFNGLAGPIDLGVFSVLHDLSDGNQATASPAATRWTDTENGNATHDGGYSSAAYPGPGAYLTVDSNGPADDGNVDTGLYGAAIDSHGRYESTVCGTGFCEHTVGDGRPATTVDLFPAAEVGVNPERIEEIVGIDTGIQPVRVRSALGPGEDIIEALYSIQFAAGSGPLRIWSATKANGEVLSGGGVLKLEPTNGGVTQDVGAYFVAGAFVIQG